MGIPPGTNLSQDKACNGVQKPGPGSSGDTGWHRTGAGAVPPPNKTPQQYLGAQSGEAATAD